MGGGALRRLSFLRRPPQIIPDDLQAHELCGGQAVRQRSTFKSEERTEKFLSETSVTAADASSQQQQVTAAYWAFPSSNWEEISLILKRNKVKKWTETGFYLWNQYLDALLQ